jgi:hypothetical protein
MKISGSIAEIYMNAYGGLFGVKLLRKMEKNFLG